MLSHAILTRKDVGRAASYYEDSADDYYAKEGDASEWQGKGALALDLRGQVDSQKLRELMAGEVNGLSTRGSTRADTNQRIGIDLTFSAPKSVSLQALIAGDGRVIQAHDIAVARAVAAAEKLAQARQKIDGKTYVENTGNLIVAKFRHETSREVDPQLHTHAVVLNLTQRKDGQWRALKNDEIIKATKFLGAIYNAELAKEMQVLGYELRHERDGNFDLAHISRDQVEGFSQRTAQILEKLKEKGLTREDATAEQKQQATMTSRARKTQMDREEVFKEWKDRANELGIDFQFTKPEPELTRPEISPGAAQKGRGLDDVDAAPVVVSPQPNEIAEVPFDIQQPPTPQGKQLDEALNPPPIEERAGEFPSGPPPADDGSFTLPPEFERVDTFDAFDGAGQGRPPEMPGWLDQDSSSVAPTSPTGGSGAAASVPQHPKTRWEKALEGAIALSPEQELVAREGATRAVRFAINHITERQSVMHRRELIDTAMRHAVGVSLSAEHIEQEIKRQTQLGYVIKDDPRYMPTSAAADPNPEEKTKTRSEWVTELKKLGLDDATARSRVAEGISLGSLERVDDRYTTQTALKREQILLQIERDGRGVMKPMVADIDRLSGAIERASLTKGQRDSASLILTSTDRIIGVHGKAGTGKSHMLDFVKNEVESSGHTMRALAPYGSQVKNLRGFGLRANTVASFLKAKNKEIDAKTVIVIDEAAVIPTRQLVDLAQLIEKTGARVVLLGDERQTKAIEAGRPYALLMEAGMKTAEMNEIKRQTNPELLRAVELASEGRAAESLPHITAVVEVKDNFHRWTRIAEDYTSLSKHDQENTLVVSGTNEARRNINAMVRDRIGTAGKGKNYEILLRRDTTQAERQFAKYYRAEKDHTGDVIRPDKDYLKTGLKQGELYYVVGTGPGNMLTVQTEDKKTEITFNPKSHKKLSVYELERTEFSAGDTVRITHNNAKLDLATNEQYKVKSIKDKSITLSDGKRNVVLDATNPMHIDHAHVTTVYSSQGLTADRVLIDTHTRSRTTAKDIYYVGISRARVDSRVYTNDEAALPRAISRNTIKYSAMDFNRLAKDRLQQQQAVNQLQKNSPQHQAAHMQQQQLQQQKNGTHIGHAGARTREMQREEDREAQHQFGDRER